MSNDICLEQCANDYEYDIDDPELESMCNCGTGYPVEA